MRKKDKNLSSYGMRLAYEGPWRTLRWNFGESRPRRDGIMSNSRPKDRYKIEEDKLKSRNNLHLSVKRLQVERMSQETKSCLSWAFANLGSVSSPRC